MSVRACYWCGSLATGTTLGATWENGRIVSRLGGRFVSCGEHGSGYVVFPPEAPEREAGR